MPNAHTDVEAPKPRVGYVEEINTPAAQRNTLHDPCGVVIISGGRYRQRIPSQRLGLWQPSAAYYRKLNVSTLVSILPPASGIARTKLEGNMIPY